MKGGGLLIDLVVASDPKLLSVVRSTIEQLSELAGFPPPECRAITRAVDEALANVIRHAYAARYNRPIQLSFRHVNRVIEGVTQSGLQITLLDRGVAFDISKVKERSLDEVKPGGLGLHFIRDCMDVVEFERSGRTNRLRLIKYNTSPQPGGQTQGE